MRAAADRRLLVHQVISTIADRIAGSYMTKDRYNDRSI